MRVRTCLPEFSRGSSGASAVFYDKLRKKIERFAKNDLLQCCSNGGWVTVDGYAAQFENIVSVSLDITVCADSKLLVLRREAQNWDKKGRLLSVRELYRSLGIKPTRENSGYDGCRIIDGNAESFVNTFKPAGNIRHASCRASFVHIVSSVKIGGIKSGK